MLQKSLSVNSGDPLLGSRLNIGDFFSPEFSIASSSAPRGAGVVKPHNFFQKPTLLVKDLRVDSGVEIAGWIGRDGWMGLGDGLFIDPVLYQGPI